MSSSVVSHVYDNIYRVRKLQRAKVSKCLCLLKNGEVFELDLTLYGDYAMHRGHRFIKKGNIWNQQ
jgi:hypothetical protein